MKINPKRFCCCDYRHYWPVEHWPACLWLLSPSCDSSVSLLYLHDLWYISVLSNCSLPLSLHSHMGEDPPPISIWSCLFPVTREFLFASVGSQALGFWKVPWDSFDSNRCCITKRRIEPSRPVTYCCPFQCAACQGSWELCSHRGLLTEAAPQARLWRCPVVEERN